MNGEQSHTEMAEAVEPTRTESGNAVLSEGPWSDSEITSEEQDLFYFQDYAEVMAVVHVRHGIHRRIVCRDGARVHVLAGRHR